MPLDATEMCFGIGMYNIWRGAWDCGELASDVAVGTALDKALSVSPVTAAGECQELW